MAEVITLTIPPVPAVDVPYRVSAILLDWDEAKIAIKLVGANGERIGHQYAGDTARTMMRALNTANLSTKSLHRRVIERLIADGVLSGAISGTPD